MSPAELIQSAVAIDKEGRRLEREAIVKWLEQRAAELRQHSGGEVEATMAQDFASAIERGEHFARS